MKKKIFSLIVILIVAICGGVFVGCGKASNKDVSISINAGLDAQEELLEFGEELFLTEDELGNLQKGNSFNNTVQNGTAVSLILGSEKYSSREVVVEVSGVDNPKIFFSTDSQAISISEIEYLSNGKAKVLISALSAGTAEVYVQTGEYSKKTSFVVKVFEPLQDISVKTGAVVYLEKGKTVEINPNSLINFAPTSSNLTEVEFWDGEKCLTQNGKTILATEETKEATGIISESKEIVVKSLRLPNGENVQTIQVVVVDNLKNIKKEKMVYNSSFEETFEEIGNNALTVIRNVQTEGGINYGVRQLKISVNCLENLEIVTKTYDQNGNPLNISALPILKTKNGSKNEFVFEFKYEGISNYVVEFGFKAGQYEYNEKITQKVEFKTASNMVEFKKVGEQTGKEFYTIYDWYNASFGTKFVASTNNSDEIKNAQISLDVSNVLDSINVLDINGNKKVVQNGKIVLNNNEIFYISAVDGKTENVEIVVKVSYVFENVLFETQKTIILKPEISPTSFNFVNSNSQTTNSFIFDLNTSGKIVSGVGETQDYLARNSIDLFLKGFVGTAFVGDVSDFEIVSNSSLINVSKTGDNKITVVALKEGTGSFQVVLGNGVVNTFKFTTIESVSSANAFLPTANQNSNIISVIPNYFNGETIYSQYAILKTKTEVPLIFDISGANAVVNVVENENISYSNGKIKTLENTTKSELQISISFKYVKNNEIATKEVVFQKILITSVVNVDGFTFQDGNKKVSIELYDLNSVGHAKFELSNSTLNLNISPKEIEQEILEQVVWSTNLESERTTTETTHVLKTKAFTLTYHRAGTLKGIVEINALVSDQKWFEQNKDKTITISASLPEQFENGGTQTISINLKIKQAEKVEVISTNVDEIHLDNFSNTINVIASTYPKTATNSALKYVFIPTENLTTNAVGIEPTDSGVTITLNSNVEGKGVLRIIAVDSYSSATTYSVYVDIPLTISNGSEKYPYYINNSNDIIKLVETNFQYYYIINGIINVDEYNNLVDENKKWTPSKFDLTGKIIGVNNAKIEGIIINDYIFDGNSTYYSGLFRTIKNHGIENVSFEIGFDLNLTNLNLEEATFYVGGIAGVSENNTQLKNVSVNITSGRILVKDSYALYFGGVVGKNSGTILNKITQTTTNNALVKYSGLLTIEDQSQTPSTSGHTLYVGGAVGYNAGGRIERQINEGVKEFNNGFETANVNLEIKYSNLNSYLNFSTEGIGGIVGLNESESTSAELGLFNVSACGAILATNFNNVGGIAGNNAITIEKAQSQVYVSGNNNVGGAVGINSGTLEAIYVENLTTLGKEILIYGNNNVGGIVGEMKEGNLESSSFISYINSTKHDISSIGQHGKIVGQYLAGTINYVVAVADIVSTETEIGFASGTYAIYSKTNKDVPVLASSGLETKSLKDLKTISGFEFIYIPTEKININVQDENLKMSKESENLAFYLYLENGNNIIKLSELLTTSEIKGLTISSNSNNVLEIFGDSVILKGTGVATLTAKSPYVPNSTEQTIYVYVVNYANSFEMFLDSNEKEKVESEETLELDASENQFIYFNFLGFNENNNLIPKDIKVKFIVNGEVVKAGQSYKIGETTIFSLIQITPTSYQIVVNEQTANLTINIVPYLEFTIGGTTYSKDLVEIGKIENLTFKFENLTKSINLSKSEIITEPYYISQVDLTFNSLDEDETLTIDAFDENGELVNDLIDIIYNNITLSSNVIENINCKTGNVLKIYFKLKNQLINENKELTVVFKSQNKKQATLKLVYQPQEVFSVNTTLYPIKSLEDEKFNLGGSFSYIPSGVIVPGQNSLIEFSINPAFTYFETIEITNVSGNEYNLVFDLFDRTTDSAILGIKPLANGVSIPSSLIQNGAFALRTFLDQRISDNSKVSIQIAFKDKEGNQIGEAFQKTFYVEQLPGVRVGVDGVYSGSQENSATNPLKLAQGLTYDLDVWVKGYSFGEFSANTSTITDGQVVFQLVGNSSLVSIAKNSNGTYQLVVNRNVNESESRFVEIRVFGINDLGERSKESVLHLEIDQFVVKTENIGDIIKDVVNNIYSSATGNSYTFEITLNSKILVYDLSNEKISAEVQNFLNDLTTNGTWKFSENGGGWQSIGTNSPFVDSTAGYVYQTRLGIFKLYYNSSTSKITVKFMKTESASVPTMQIQYFANFHYENGKPTVGIGEGNVYSLTQTISFEVSEKTTLRNPYPIYNASQLNEMKEGNYYILMEDITLPEDFVPISTKIGGFDGNNKTIKISNITIQASDRKSIKFGLFESVADDSIVKNVVFEIDGPVYVSLYDYNTISFGLLAAENNGKITNCRIVGTSKYSILNLNLYGKTNSTTISNNVGGLVSINKGDITNCQIEAGIAINSVQNNATGCLTANLGGLVATNQGSIASCYVTARIENNTAGSVSAITGGIVAENQTGATIFATYISGEETFPDEISTAGNIVYSTAKAGGFVYLNKGEISNCFSNIPVVATDGASGFVYNNGEGGLVSKSYSTSALESSAKNGSFVGLLTGVVEDENPVLNSGTLEECYSWVDQTIGNINSGLGPNKVEGLKLVNENDFAKQKDKEGYLFEQYVFSTTSLKTDGVWFWANNGTETQFVKDGKSMSFSAKAPQLVSPNILARGSQELVDTIYNEETQTTVYVYSQEEKYQEGSKYNPYLIATEEDLEFMVSSQSGLTNGIVIKNIYCRLLGSIVYETSTASSGLYQYAFLGNLEGNGYTIGNYVLDSSVSMSNGGFFASLGTLTNQGGTIKNVTFAPRYMSLTNCNAVGAIAGTAYGSTLVNIIIDGETYSLDQESVTIIGRNVVGGVVGVAEGSFNFNNIKVNISTNATYRSSLNGHLPVEYTGVITKVSYSGLIAGVVNGYGEISYIEVGGKNVSVGEYAGLVFGYVGKHVKAVEIVVNGEIGQSIKADVYGGVVAGHSSGTLKHIKINGLNDPSYSGFFSYENHVPTGIGNIVGYMTGGIISDAKVNTKIIADSDVYALGGAVGYMVSGKIEKVQINGDITGGSRIGGLVGYVKNSGNYLIEIENSSYKGNILSNSSSSSVAVGTIIGYVADFDDDVIKDNKIKIKNSGSKTEDVSVKVITYSTAQGTEIWVGEVVYIQPDLIRGVWDINKGNTDYVFPTYKPNSAGWYVPLSSACKINGVQWRLENKVWKEIPKA